MASAHFSKKGFYPFNWVRPVVHSGIGNTVDKNYSMALTNQTAEGVNLTSSSIPLNKRFFKNPGSGWLMSSLAPVCSYELGWHPGHKRRPCWCEPCPVPLCGGKYWQRMKQKQVSQYTLKCTKIEKYYSNTKFLCDRNHKLTMYFNTRPIWCPSTQ